jgi:hypothetical protein
VKTAADLIDQLRRLGVKLDDATDPATMKYLLRCRRALYEAIESARVAEAPCSGVTLRIAEGTRPTSPCSVGADGSYRPIGVSAHVALRISVW